MNLFAELKKLFARMDILDVIKKPISILESAGRLVELREKAQISSWVPAGALSCTALGGRIFLSRALKLS